MFKGESSGIDNTQKVRNLRKPCQRKGIIRSLYYDIHQVWNLVYDDALDVILCYI